MRDERAPSLKDVSETKIKQLREEALALDAWRCRLTSSRPSASDRDAELAEAFAAGQLDMRARAEAEVRPKIRRGAITAGLDRAADRIAALEVVDARRRLPPGRG